MKKAIAAGHCCLDITPVIPDRGLTPDEMFAPGKLTGINGVQIHTGGSCTNTGLAMKVLGADVTLMGKVGRDEFGDLVREIIWRHGGPDAADHMIVSEDAATSFTFIMAIPGIDRSFLAFPGANDSFGPEDLQDEVLKEAVHFHFGYPSVMKRMYENDGEALVQIFRHVKELGLSTSLDTCAIDPASPAAKADWVKIISRVLPYVDFFMPSMEELCCMMDPAHYAVWEARAAGKELAAVFDLDEDVKPLADRLFTLGAKAVLIKCGAPGLYFRTAGQETLKDVGSKLQLDTAAWAGKDFFTRSFQPDRILSATGAGDTCIAAFLTALLQGYTAEKCTELAAATGASCVEAYDSLSGLRPFAELEQKICAGWKRTGA